MKQSRARLAVPASKSLVLRQLAGQIEFELRGPAGFPPGDLAYTLLVGGQRFETGRYPEHSDYYTILFTVPLADFQALPDGAEVRVGRGPSATGMSFGSLDKSAVGQP